MAKKSEVFVGAIFGRLTVVSETSKVFCLEGKRNRPVLCVTCICSCGSPCKSYRYYALGGSTNSCGCLSREVNKERLTTHGQTHTSEYRAWSRMWARTTDKNGLDFLLYRDRAPPERWKTFENFFADMGNRPVGMSLERKDNTKAYSPQNCKWATQAEQQNNRGTNIYVSHKAHGVMTFAQAVRFNDLSVSKAASRRRRRWSLDKILESPSWSYANYSDYLIFKKEQQHG